MLNRPCQVAVFPDRDQKTASVIMLCQDRAEGTEVIHRLVIHPVEVVLHLVREVGAERIIIGKISSGIRDVA